MNYKVPILDMAVWVEDMLLPAQGMEDDITHSSCTEGECLPIGTQKVKGLEEQPIASTRLVPQVNYDFYAKSSAPKTTIFSCSANPWQQKRTVFTQKVIRK